MAEKILSRLKPPAGAVKRTKRLGRGPGSGLGKTSGRGHKGKGQRSGSGPGPRFEGGQMPLSRRLPKRGFHNLFRKEYTAVNVERLQDFAPHSVVDVEALQQRGLVPKHIQVGVKILGNGELSVPLKVRAHRFSQSARQKIEAAGGTIEVIEGAE